MPEATFLPLPHLAGKAELASAWLGLTLWGKECWIQPREEVLGGTLYTL